MRSVTTRPTPVLFVCVDDDTDVNPVSVSVVSVSDAIYEEVYRIAAQTTTTAQNETVNESIVTALSAAVAKADAATAAVITEEEVAAEKVPKDLYVHAHKDHLQSKQTCDLTHRPLHVDCRPDAFLDSTRGGRETLVLQVDSERVRAVAADARCYVEVDDYLHELLCCEGHSDLDVERVGVDFHAHVFIHVSCFCPRPVSGTSMLGVFS